MRGLGLGQDEVWDTTDDDLEAVDSPETLRSPGPTTTKGLGHKRPDIETVDDLYDGWE
jgi:hypothetical protein